MKNIKTFIITVLALFIFMPTNTKAALTDIEFSSGGKIDEETYVYTGNDGSNSAVVMKKLDGTILWTKEYTGLELNALTVTTDGYIVVVGVNKIIKFDTSGNIIWEKDLTGKYLAIIPEENGAFTFSGQNVDGLVIKFDKDGNELARGKLVGAHGANFRGLDKTKDGGYIAVGLTYSHDLGIRDTCTAIIAKFDKDFNLVWNTYFGGNNSDEYSGVATDKDGNYLAVGRTYSPEKVQFSTNGTSDAVIVKYDKDGNVLWEKIYGGTDHDRFKAISITEDGVSLVAGFSKSSEIATNGGYDSLLLNVDKDGNILKEEVFGTPDGDETYGMIPMSDSIIVLLGLFPTENEYFKDGSMVFKKSFKVELDTTLSDKVSIQSDTFRYSDNVEINIDESIKDKVFVKIYNLNTNKEVTNLVNYKDGKFVMPGYDVKVVVGELITVPPTGDNILTYMILALISVVAITSILIFSKKDTKSSK